MVTSDGIVVSFGSVGAVVDYFVALLLHIGYSIYTYAAFYYNPFLTRLFSDLMITLACLHAVLGMSIVFLMGDGTSLAQYPRKNLHTVIQRLSAPLFFPLLMLHIRTFDLLRSIAEKGRWFGWSVIIAVEVLFFADILAHTAVSLSRALITLGWLSSREKQIKLDRIIYICAILLFAAAVVSVIRGQIIMFRL